MSWFEPIPNKKPDNEKKETVIQKFFTMCLLFLGAVLLLAFAIDLLSRIWIWVALIALLFVAYRIWRNKHDRW